MAPYMAISVQNTNFSLFCTRCGGVALLEVGSRAKTPKTQTSEGHGERRWGDIHMGRTQKRREKVPGGIKRTQQCFSLPARFCTNPVYRASARTQPTQVLGDALSPAHLAICPPYEAGGLPETLEGATGEGS